jgi:aspartyl-tRNA(Asn)/glutamyl-tRNA(Gln) amidotransferase subunit A
MTVTDEILDYPVVRLQQGLEAGAFTSVELTEGYLARIDRLGGRLNCFITVTADRARADAAEADADRAGGRRGPLLGIPYALKDIVDTAGIVTSWGTPSGLDRVPAADAPVAAKLAAAGGVLLGKLSLTELANGLGNVSPDANHKGACKNPWNVSTWAGGSSSGSGSATAAALTGWSVGTETWGSIDCPASYCGVVGLRPTFDVVSRAGVMTLCWTLDKVGMLCRDARDCRGVLSVMAETPPPGLDAPLGDRALRIGYVDADDPAVQKHFDAAYQPLWAAAKDVLGAAGASFEKVTLPVLPIEVATAAVLIAEIIAALEDFGRERGKRLYDRKPFQTSMDGYRAMGLRAEDYVKGSRVRTQAQRAYAELFARYDVIVCPGRPELPAPVDKDFAWEDFKSPHGELQAVGNAIGAPAITLPMGFTAKGLPQSMHAIAAPYDDHKVIALGEAYQARTDFHQQRPRLS